MTRLAAVLAAGALATAAQVPQGSPPSFRAEIRLVVLQVTVRNGRGEVVTGLDQTAFTVRENGHPQPVKLFRRDDVPVSLGVLIDNSGSMRPIRGQVESAALAFARASNPLDELFVLNFADTVSLDVPMTRDRDALQAGIARADAIGGTAIRDAVDTAETYLAAHAGNDRKALLIITDGNDNASMARVDRVTARAQQQGTAVYAIGLFGGPDAAQRRRGHHELDSITEATGGFAYYPATPDQVESIAVEIARQIRAQYTIAYAPLDQREDGSYRAITVEARRGHERLEARTRKGYAAPRHAVGDARER